MEQEKIIDLGIDGTVKKVHEDMGGIFRNNKVAKRKDLELIFDSQIQKLDDAGMPGAILARLRTQKSAVVEKALAMRFDTKRLPFVPVIPFSYLGPHGQMLFMKTGENPGFTCINPNMLEDATKTPFFNPYFIFDVGCNMEANPKDSNKSFYMKNVINNPRSPLTAAEVIAFAMQTSVLKITAIGICGSRYDKTQMPILYFCTCDDRVELSFDDFDSNLRNYGVATCDSRL